MPPSGTYSQPTTPPIGGLQPCSEPTYLPNGGPPLPPHTTLTFPVYTPPYVGPTTPGISTNPRIELPNRDEAIYKGMPYTHRELKNWGYRQPRNPHSIAVGSEGFGDFYEDYTGKTFIEDDWVYKMESWYSDEEDEWLENHYWYNQKTGETFHHD